MTTLEWLEKNTLADGEEELLDRDALLDALLRMFPKWPEDVAFNRVYYLNAYAGQRGEVRGLGMTLKPKRLISYGDTAAVVCFS